MVALPMRRREEVYGYISTVLRERLAEELARLPSKTSKASYECLTSVVSALQTVVSSAIKDFSEQWAAPHVDPLMALPGELVAECFAHLDLRGRIAVSHVSQAWRSFALAERTLWNTYEVGANIAAETAARTLEALISRSDPAPFFLTYEHIPSDSHHLHNDGEAGADSVDGIMEIALRNMERMASLTLSVDAAPPQLLFDPSLSLRMPQLKLLEYAQWEDIAPTVSIPVQWASRCVPHLEVLILREVFLPARCEPFASLRTLDAHLPPEAVFPGVTFTELFPSLRTLRLCGVEQHSLSMLTPLPPSIEVVWLYSWVNGGLDYTQFVQACDAVKIRGLQLLNASHFSDALEMFVRKSTGLWTMHVRDDDLEVRLEDASCGLNYGIKCHRAISLTHEPRFSAHLERLGGLTLSLRSFVDLHQLGARVLPALRSLALFIVTDNDIEAGRAFATARTAAGGEPELSLPALQSLKLLPGNDTDFTGWLAQDAPALLPRLLRGSKLPLGAIRLRIVGMPRLSPEDRDRLFPFARRVIVQSASAPGMSELVFDSERVQENPEGTWAPWSG